MANENEDIGKLAADLKKAADTVKSSAEQTQTELRNLGAVQAETKRAADEALIKHNELAARLDELEKKQSRRGSGGDGAGGRKSVGEIVTDNDSVKAFMSAKNRGNVRVGVKAIITSATNDALGSAGDLVQRERVGGIIAAPDRRLTVRDLLTPGTTGSNALEYVRETGFVNNSAVVAEGALKPQSDIKFDLLTTPVVTIAHWVQASKQILDDAAQLRSYIDGRLRFGLQFVEEAQLLKGSGTGGNLQGIYTVATPYAAPFVLAGATMIDNLRLGLLQAALAEYPATGMVLNPMDWARIELTKTSEGAYLFANPTTMAGPRLWGLPVVETQAMNVDEWLAGAFKLGAQIFDREDAAIEVSTEDRDNFIRNLVTIRAEERLGLAIYRPESFIKGDFGNVT